jgi:hypothetical protein
MFSLKDVADYYNSTQIHYEKWWVLKESKSLHYGIWGRTTRTLQEALEKPPLPRESHRVLIYQSFLMSIDNIKS